MPNISLQIESCCVLDCFLTGNGIWKSHLGLWEIMMVFTILSLFSDNLNDASIYWGKKSSGSSIIKIIANINTQNWCYLDFVRYKVDKCMHWVMNKHLVSQHSMGILHLSKFGTCKHANKSTQRIKPSSFCCETALLANWATMPPWLAQTAYLALPKVDLEDQCTPPCCGYHPT